MDEPLCERCEEPENAHCQECFACPDTGHLNTCSLVDEGAYYL